MVTFQYSGRDRAGRSTRGIVSADTIRAARDQLRELGVSVKRIDARRVSGGSELLKAWKRRRFSSQLTSYLRELATLLQAAIPLMDAMDICSSQVNRALQEPLVATRDRVAGGLSLAEAMQQENWLFDEMLLGMVQVGEHAGNLEVVLDQVATFREQSEQLKDRVLSALLYPAIVFCVSIAVTLFLMTVVVPMLLQNLVELGRELPWPTRLLKTMSDVLIAHGWWLTLVGGVLVAISIAAMNSQAGRRIASKLMFRIPVLGELVRKQTIGRLALVISCLLKSGVELIDAIRISECSCSNILLREALQRIRSDLEKGRGLRESISSHKLFPAAVSQIFFIGQQSGQLDSMLELLGRDYDRQASVLANRVASLAEPALILLLSVMVGFIMFATILPILEAGNVLAN